LKANNFVYIILSLSALILLLFLYVYTPKSVNPFKTFFISIFMLICFLGILASLYPSSCMRIFKIETVKVYECRNKLIKNKGHHPDCGEFHEHVFSVDNKKYCVGCAGLLTGALLGILTCIIYLIYGFLELILWIGVIIVFTCLLQLIFINSKNKMIKFLSNSGLVEGSALVMVGLVEYSNPFLCLYFLFLIGAIIMTRSAISREKHDQICLSCNDYYT
jgi:hypothetical protein